MAVQEIVPGRKLPTKQVCGRYLVTDRTVSRWERDPELNFPKPTVINRRKYFDEEQLARWDSEQAAKGRTAK